MGMHKVIGNAEHCRAIIRLSHPQTTAKGYKMSKKIEQAAAKIENECAQFGRTSADIAFDQRNDRAYDGLEGSIAAHRDNVRDTLNEQGNSEHDAIALAAFDQRVDELRKAEQAVNSSNHVTEQERTYAAAALPTMNDDGLDWIQLTPGRILLAQPDGAWIAKSTDSDMLPILLERVGDCWMKDDGDEEHEGELVGIAGGPQSLPSLVSALVAKQDEKEATPYAQGYALRRSSPDAPMICNYPHGSTERNEWFIGWNAADALAAALVAKQDDGDEEHEVGHGGDCAKQMHGMAECTCGFDENADPDDLAPQMHEVATMMHALADKLADTSVPFDLIKRLHDVADDMEQLAGESLDKAEEARHVFEVLGQGFNGGTDATDDRVLWIVADSLNDVTAAINGMGGSVSEIPDMDDERAGRLGTIDFTLPDDTAALRERMAKWVQA